MNDRDPTGPSDERISRLSAAILRISQSLDLATVLEEVVESARVLTGARSGAITTIDERGEMQDLVTSGLSPDERRKMLEWPDGPRLFEHLRDLPAPLRVADMRGFLRSLGLSPNPWSQKTMQGTPMRHPSLPISVRHLVPLGLLKGAEVDGDGRGERYDDWYGCGRLGPGGRGA